MIGKPALIACVVSAGLAAAAPVAAQQQTNPSLEDWVRALGARLAQGSAPNAPSASQTPPQAVAQAPVAPRPIDPNPTGPALAERVEQNTVAVQAQQTRISAVEQKAADTTVTGRMYYNITNISQTSDGVNQPSRGTGLDAKRFYVSVDHRFDSMFSGHITTDFNYVTVDKSTQLFIKKAYLQAAVSDAVVIRLGSAETPWVPFVEVINGHRYIEKVLEDRTKFGTSADWGIHVLGALADGMFNYQISVLNGAGYKQLTRSKGMDVEARLNFNYRNFVFGLGSYTGKLGKDVEGTTAYHDATRFDAILAYTGMGARIGVQYMRASNWNTVTAVAGDSSDGVSVFGSYRIDPRWSVFSRYDWMNPSKSLNAKLTDRYLNIGVTYSPAQIVDFSLVYKHEEVNNGFFATANGTIGGLVNAPGHSGSYDEVGLFGRFRW